MGGGGGGEFQQKLIIWQFQGVRTPCPPSGSAHVSDKDIQKYATYCITFWMTYVEGQYMCININIVNIVCLGFLNMFQALNQ